MEDGKRNKIDKPNNNGLIQNSLMTDVLSLMWIMQEITISLDPIAKEENKIIAMKEHSDIFAKLNDALLSARDENS